MRILIFLGVIVALMLTSCESRPAPPPTESSKPVIPAPTPESSEPVVSMVLSESAASEPTPELSEPTAVTSVPTPEASEPAAVTSAPSPEASQPTQSAEQTAEPFVEDTFPLLVNAAHPLPQAFQPDAVWDENLPYPFSAKGMPALKAMISAAAQDGIFLQLISGYRSVESQTRNFNAKVQEHLAAGKTEEEAIAATAMYIAYPGTSEHNLGLAADLNSLYDSFDKTAEFRWLSQHAADYGFVLRYPKDKVSITGIAYEPWHYRYVGSNHARRMNEEGLCLEEYVAAYGNGS